MDPTLLTALVGLGGVAVGALLTAGLEDWRSRRADERASRRASGDRVAAWQLDRIRQTRRMMDGTVMLLEAMTTGNLKEHARGQALLRTNPDGNLALVGDLGLMREMHDLFVHLNKRAARGLDPEDVIRRIELIGRAQSALDDQERRLLRGDALIEVNRNEAPELFDAYTIGARMDAFRRPASLTSRLAMTILRRFYLRRPGSG